MGGFTRHDTGNPTNEANERPHVVPTIVLVLSQRVTFTVLGAAPINCALGVLFTVVYCWIGRMPERDEPEGRHADDTSGLS